MRASARITGAAAAVAVVALLVSGCGSSGDEGGGGGSESPAAEPSTQPEGGGGESRKIDVEALAGGWVTSGEPDTVLIMAFAEKTVMLTGAANCTGTAAVDADPVTLDLDCRSGGEDYGKATVKSLDADKLTVEWDSGKSATFTRATDDEGNPKDLPGGIPSDLPTDAAPPGS